MKHTDNKHMFQRAVLGPMIAFNQKFSGFFESLDVV